MSVQVETPIQYLKGVGPKLASFLEKRGVLTVFDLLEWYPRSYVDQRGVLQIASLKPGQDVSFQARLLKKGSFAMGRSRRRIYELVVGDETGRITCRFFRMPYRGYFDQFEKDQELRVSGRVTHYRGRIQMQHPLIDGALKENEQRDYLLPLYTETEGLSQSKIRKMISTALEDLLKFQFLSDPLPLWLKEKYGLLDLKEALKNVHRPPEGSGEEYLNFGSSAHRRLIFDEFFWIELRLALRKNRIQEKKSIPLEKKENLVKRFKKSLPFELTGDQEKVYEEILQDLLKSRPMHRLLQGDVGSGKTVVALMVSALVAENKLQTALMVPTEILAQQHYDYMLRFLKPLGLKVAFLSSQMKAKKKKEVYEGLKDGEFHICVGTHALLQESVEFKNLGLVIIDEQHRFGVYQRTLLLKKAKVPHFLVMTATPIPRTLALTVYGDLDLSFLKEKPKGRRPVLTRRVFQSKRAKVIEFLKEQLCQGRQAYVIYPLIEESEKLTLKNAQEGFETLCAELPSFSVGLVHGRLKSEEKEKVMRSFRENQIQVLVSTTVVEVGVDVPNATFMMIENAERFGLSQLHQLRGRVGRGSYKSYCVLVLGQALSEDSLLRAEIMESTTDGFRVAEEDLKLRGPGEFLGLRQSGLPGFRMAHLLRDQDILAEARQAAFEIVGKDPQFQRSEHSLLKKQFAEKTSKLVG